MKKEVLEIMLKNSQNIDIKGLSEILKISDRPRTTNIGGLEPQNKLNSNGYKLDWFAFTVKNSGQMETILTTLNYSLDEFKDSPPRYFYNTGLTLGNYVNIYYNSKDKEVNKTSSNTINFVFTGQGCTDLALRFENDIFKIFNLLYPFKIKVTRLDLAFDDFTGVFDFNLIKSKLERGEYRSSKKTYNIVKSSNTKKERLGETIYFGSSRIKKGFYLKMYDKRSQYVEKKQILPDIVNRTGIWQRCEISFIKSKADDVFHYFLFDEKYINNVDRLYKETLRNIVEFLDVKFTKNGVPDKKERWTVCSWWNDFLEFDEKMKFIDSERDVDFGKLLYWLTVNIMPNLKLLEEAFDLFDCDLYEVIKEFNFSKPYSKKQERLFHQVERMNKQKFESYLQMYFYSQRNDKNEDL